MGFRDKPGSLTDKPEAAGTSQTQKQPATPVAYCLQHAPRVLETRKLAPQRIAKRPRQVPPHSCVPSHQDAPNLVRTTINGQTPVQPKIENRPGFQPSCRAPSGHTVLRMRPPANATTARRVIQRTPVPAVVQATKYYPNLHPGAIEPIDRGNVFRLNSFANQYRLHKVNSHGVNVPNQQYNFVRTREGEMLLHARYRHPSIAEGKQVLYAGEIFFNNGQLEWWSNGSGHYQPFAEDAEQANLPMDHFFSYQQVIKGEHKRKQRG
jgi:hypothetical protein